jgi:hypothetical protein
MLKFSWKHKRQRIDKAIQHLTSNYTTELSQKKQNGTGTKNRHEGQWNRIEDLDMNPCGYVYLIFYKGAQNI